MSTNITKFPECVEHWLDPENGPAAVVLKERLRAVDADDDEPSTVFPPTYPPPEEKKKEEKSGYNLSPTRNGKICLIDSVGSQANRLEPIFKNGRYAKLVPQVTVKLGDTEEPKNLLDVGHRAGDALIRCTDLADEMEKAFIEYGKKGNSASLAKISPTSLVFGVWDSRGTQVKVPRLLASTIEATDVDEKVRSAQYTPATDFGDKKEGLLHGIDGADDQKLLSKAGFSHAPSPRTPGGVEVHGQIIRKATLSLVAVRDLRGKDAAETKNLQRYILGLALTALTANQGKALTLRQGCQLVRFDDKGTAMKVVSPNGSRTEIDIPHDAATKFAETARRTLEWANPGKQFSRASVPRRRSRRRRRKKSDATVPLHLNHVPPRRFHGRTLGDRAAEWPPSPLRLFQTLVATAHRGRGEAALSDAEERALQWLESLCERHPPTIAARPSKEASPYIIAIPNNDLDVWARPLAEGREPKKQPNELRTMKTVRPTAILDEPIAEAEDNSTVRFIWSLEATNATEHAEPFVSVRRLARRIIAIGWGSDLVAADAHLLTEQEVTEIPGARWRPGAAIGDSPSDRPVPMRGTLNALRIRHSRWRSRVNSKCKQYDDVPPYIELDEDEAPRLWRAYEPGAAFPPRPFAAFKLVRPDDTSERFAAFPQYGAVHVAAMLRHAACDAAKRDLDPEIGRDEAWGNRVVAGHGMADNRRAKDDDSPRLSYLPLPSFERRGNGKADVVATSAASLSPSSLAKTRPTRSPGCGNA